MTRRIRMEELLEILLVSASLFGPGHVLLDFLRYWVKKRRPYSQAVDEATSALERASTLTAELQSELLERKQMLEQLMADCNRYTALAASRKEEAHAFLEELDRQLRKSSRRERWWAIGINLVVGLVLFVLGVIFGDAVKGLVGL